MSGPLSSGDLANLRSPSGTHAFQGYLAVVPQNVLATARINQTTFTQPLAELTVDTTSAGWSSVLAGHTCWIGTTAGAHDVGIFRVRATPTATILYLQEISPGDFGLLPVTTLQALANDHYITIIADLNRWAVFPRIVYSNGVGTFYKAYNVAYSNQNELGGAVPAICNIGPHRAGFTDAADELSLPFSASAWSFNGSSTGFSWNFADGTPSSGTGTGPHTVVFPPGYRLVGCAMTMSGGATISVGRHVWAFDNDTYAPYHVTRASSRKNKQGRRMTFEVVGEAYNTTPIQHGAMVNYFENPTYNGATIASATTTFAGWVESVRLKGERDGVQTWEVEVVSALELMRNTILHAQQLAVVTNPANWQEVSGSLAHLDFVLHYLLYWHTSLTSLFDIRISEGAYQANAWKTDRGNLTDELNRLGERLNLTVNQDSSGTIWLRRDQQMLETAALRNAVDERITLTQDDISDISFQRNLLPMVGEVKANGLSTGTSAEGRFAARAYAPGQVAGQGAGIETLENQLVGGDSLTPQAQLNLRAANKFAYVNRALGTITVTLARSNYENLIEPAEAYWVRLNLPAGYSPDGSALNIRCVPLEVTVTYNEDGTKDGTLLLEPETSGIAGPGQTIPVEVGNDKPLTEIQFPPYNPLTGLISIPYTPFGTNFPVTGTEINPFESAETEPTGFLLAWSQDAAALSRRPTQPGWLLWFEAAGEQIQSIVFDPRSPKLTTNKQSGDLRLWIATDTALYYCANALAGSPVVEQQQVFTDFTPSLLRAINGLVDGIAVYGDQNGGGTWTQTFDFTQDNGGFAATAGWLGGGDATYTASTGWEDIAAFPSIDGDYRRGASIIITFSSTTITSISFTLNFTEGSTNNTLDAAWGIFREGFVALSIRNFTQVATGNGQVFTWTGSQGLTAIHGYFLAARNNGSPPIGGDVTILNCTVMGTGVNPFTGESGGNAKRVVFSDDTGDTITARTAGNSQLGDGMDWDDFNLPVCIAAEDDRLYFLTSYTGYFTQMATVDAGTAHINLVRIPKRILTGTSYNNSATALHFIYGMDAADGSGRTLVRAVFNSVTNSATLTDITPVIASVTYRPVGPEALETYAGDSRVMLMFAVPVGGGATVLLFRSAAGTWSVANTSFDGNFVRWKSSQAAYLAGPDGLRFTPDRGITLQTLDGNYETLIDAFPARGLIGAG